LNGWIGWRTILWMPQAKTVPGKSPYSVSPCVPMTQRWIAALPEKTGKSLDQWIA